MKKAIIVAGFGTTNESALRSCILPLEQTVAAAFPDWDVLCCFTSQMVIRSLSRREIYISSLDQTLSSLIAEHYQHVVVLPALLTEGGEYDKIMRLCESCRSSFASLMVAKPLLAGEQDLRAVADFISHTYPLRDNEALLLMGHGTAGSDNQSLCALTEALQALDSRLFLAALVGKPFFSGILQSILNAGCKKIILAPLMLTAGTHTVQHLSGSDASSWQNQCISAGLEVTCDLKGLGEYPEIRERYLQHLSACLPEK